MNPVLFSDHLRTLRDSARARPGGRPGLDIIGAGRLTAAACAACLLMLTIQTALSEATAPLAEPALAALDIREESK